MAELFEDLRLGQQSIHRTLPGSAALARCKSDFEEFLPPVRWN